MLFRSLIERSEDHNAFRIEQIAAKYDLEDDEARVLFLRDAARMLAGIESTIEREVYAGRAAKMAGVTAEAMNVEVRRELGIQRKRRKAAERREIRSPVGLAQPKDRSLAYTDMKSAKAEENVLRLLFSDQKLIAVAEKDLQPAWFSAPVLRKIYERVLELNRNDQMVDVLSFEGWLEPNEMSLLSAILEPGIPARRASRGTAGIHKHHTNAARQGWNHYAGGRGPAAYIRTHQKTKRGRTNDMTKANANAAANAQEQQAAQQQILHDLLALGKKNGRLTLKEISDALSHLELSSEDIDKVYETLETMGIEVETNGVLEKVIGDDDDSFEPEEVEEVPEEELVDTSAMAETFAIDDPVRMYLKEIGKVDLLSPEEEVTLAERMQKGQRGRRAYRKRRRCHSGGGARTA